MNKETAGQHSFKGLVRRLAKEGPVKTHPTPRRVRILFNGAIVGDTLGTPGAMYVWEHEYYPQLYLPVEALVPAPGFDVVISTGDNIDDGEGHVFGVEIKVSVKPVGGSNDEFKSLSDIVRFAGDLEGKAKPLRNLVKVDFGAVDQWFEEDTPIFVHPKDPFKRVDLLSSTRPIKVVIDGKVVAESAFSIHLYETSLPARFYLPFTSIDTSTLRPSDTRTQCPYKGEALYHNVVVNGKEYKDIVWYYSRPTVESAAIAGLRCFYNEKVDIWLQENGQWVKQERPKTHFA